jgi:hypothetical protein
MELRKNVELNQNFPDIYLYMSVQILVSKYFFAISAIRFTGKKIGAMISA